MRRSEPGHVGAGYLSLFASLYAVQGVVVAYFFNFNQIYMVSSGISNPIAARVQSLALLPFIFKFLGGPLSDRVNLLGFGHRKPYIVLGVLLQIVGLIALSLLHPARWLSAFTLTAVATVTGLALYDTCCDGMVIDVTPPHDRSRVQGLLVASRALAAMVCSLVFGAWLGDDAGQGPDRYHKLLWACAALSLVPLSLALLLPEPTRADDAEEFNWRALRVLITRRALVLLTFGAVYSTLANGVEINLSPYYRLLKFGDTDIGAFGAARYAGRAVGAGLLSLASTKLSRRWVLSIGILALAATTAAQAAVGGRVSAGAAGFAFGAANGWDDAVFFVLAMEASDPRMAASTYALFMAVTNVSVLGGGLFAELVARVGRGFGPAFLAVGLASLAPLLLIGPLSRPPSSKPEPRHGLDA